MTASKSKNLFLCDCVYQDQQKETLASLFYRMSWYDLNYSTKQNSLEFRTSIYVAYKYMISHNLYAGRFRGKTRYDL